MIGNQQYKALKAELAEAHRQADFFQDHLSKQNTELAASEARERQLREALEKLARLGNEPQFGNSIGNQIAQAALATPTDTTALREFGLRVAREVASGRAIRLVDIVDEVLGK